MTTAVLDASALLALLLGEAGGEDVAALFPDAAICVVNIGEVVAYYARAGTNEAAIRRLLDPLALERVPADEPLAYAAGMMLPITRSAGLSLGDRFCLALARRLAVRAVTADRKWLQVAGAVGVDVVLIR